MSVSDETWFDISAWIELSGKFVTQVNWGPETRYLLCFPSASKLVGIFVSAWGRTFKTTLLTFINSINFTLYLIALLFLSFLILLPITLLFYFPNYLCEGMLPFQTDMMTLYIYQTAYQNSKFSMQTNVKVPWKKQRNKQTNLSPGLWKWTKWWWSRSIFGHKCI